MLSESSKKRIQSLAKKTAIVSDTVKTPIGNVHLLASPKGIVALSYQQLSRPSSSTEPNALRQAKRTAAQAAKAVAQYFAGQTEALERLQVDPQGTDFQKQVWNEMRKIKPGKTISYGRLASRIHKPDAFRAVAGACGQNPVILAIPCHRVVAADNKLGGFSAGLHRKKFLHSLEAIELA